MQETHPRGELDAQVVTAVRDLLWRVVPYGTTEDGDVAHYIVSKGTVHRLVGAMQGAGYSASLRAFDGSDSAPQPEEA
jgi:hypothetical protein